MDINLKGLKAPERKRNVNENIALLKQKAMKHDRKQKLKFTTIYASVAALFIVLFALQLAPTSTTNSTNGAQVKSVEHKTYEEYLRNNQPSPWYALGTHYLSPQQMNIFENYIEPVVYGSDWTFGGIDSQHYIDRIFAFDIYFIEHTNGFDQYVYGLTYVEEINSYALVDFVKKKYIPISNEEVAVLKNEHLPLWKKLLNESMDLLKTGLIGVIIYVYYVTVARISPNARRSFVTDPSLINWIIKFILFGFILWLIKVINIGMIGYLNGLLLLVVFAIFFFIRKVWGNSQRSWLEIPLSTAAYLLAMILYA